MNAALDRVAGDVTSRLPRYELLARDTVDDELVRVSVPAVSLVQAYAIARAELGRRFRLVAAVGVSR